MFTLRPDYDMKDSCIPWIGLIPSNWQIRPVKALFSLTTGFTPASENDALYDDDGEVWITISDMKSETVTDSKQKISKEVALQHNKDMVKAGGLLYSFKLSVGTVAFAGVDLYTNEAIAAFQPITQDVSLQYLKYASSLIAGNATTNIYGATIMNQRLILNAPLPVPALEEQLVIAQYLDNCCTKINEEIAEASVSIEEYKNWKASIIYEAVTKGLDKDIDMKDSGVEWQKAIPSGWSFQRLKFLTTDIIDCPHETPEYTPNGKYYVIRTADQDYTRLRDDQNMYRLDENEYQNRIRRMSLDKDDIVYGREGERWGLACLVPESGKYCLGQRMMQFRCKKDVFLPAFAVYALSSPDVRRQGEYDTLGSTSPHVNISTIKNYYIPVPNSLSEQERIAQYLDKQTKIIDSLVSEKEALISDLEAYKKSLIFEVVTGKRKVV